MDSGSGGVKSRRRNKRARKKEKMRKVILQHKFWLAAVILSVVGVTVDELLKAFLLQYILDSAVAGEMEGLKLSCLFTAGYLILTMVFGLFYDTTTNNFTRVCMETVKNGWMRKIEEKRLCEYDVQKSSVYLSHFTVDTVTLEEDYLQNFFLLIRYLLTGAASLIVVWTVHYYFVIFILATFWFPLLINHFWSKKITESRMEASRSSGSFLRLLKETLTGFEVETLYGLSGRREEAFRKENHALEMKRFWSRWTKDASGSTGGTASVLIWLGSLLVGSYLALQSLITVGTIVRVNQLLNNLVNPLYRVSLCLTKMKAAKEIYRRVNEELEEGALPKTAKEKQMEELLEFSDRIELKHVGISFAGRQILKDVGLCFEKGKKYLLTGESGCGKSTLLKLLLDYYPAYEGEILIDGHEMSRVRTESWYCLAAVVGQSDFLFEDTLRNNLCLFREVTEQKLQEILEICCLKHFVELHPGGLEFRIEENGKNISGGERQRICLARALLKGAPVLILDEAFSALDGVTALRIEKNLLSLPEITVIAISHKLFPEAVAMYDARIQLGNQTAKKMTQ